MMKMPIIFLRKLGIFGWHEIPSTMGNTYANIGNRAIIQNFRIWQEMTRQPSIII